ncbi:MAG: NUDIX hydrolase [archaeon]
MNKIVLVGGVVHNDGKILILRRLTTKRFFPGSWEIPGGKIDDGESPEEAVLREVKEETGLDAMIDKVFHTWSDIIERNNRKEHMIVINFILRLVKAQPVVLSEKEHSEFRWIERDDAIDKVTSQMSKTIKLAFEEITQS